MTRTAWSGGIWVVVITIVLATFSLTFASTALVRVGTSGPCNDPASVAELHDARVALVLQLVVVLGAWLAVAVWRRRPEIAVVGLVASGYAIHAAFDVLTATRAEWTGMGFCF